MEKDLKTTEVMETNSEEIMEQKDTNDIVESSGMSSGVAMLIGGALALSAVAGVKKLKKVWNKRKSRKELSQNEIVDDEFYDDEIEEIFEDTKSEDKKE